MNPTKDNLAGSWYPATASELRRAISVMTAGPPRETRSDLDAMILPHAGYAYSGTVAARTVSLLPRNRFQRVVLLGPSHRVPLDGRLATPGRTGLATPLGQVPLDHEALSLLHLSPAVEQAPAAHRHEHSLRIILPLLQYHLGHTFSLVPLITGRLDSGQIKPLADLIRPLLTETTLLIASSDFTHYGPAFGYQPFGDNPAQGIEKLDRSLIDLILSLNIPGFLDLVAKTGATVCGRDPIALLMQLLPSGARGHLAAYETSGGQSGDYSHSVSYAGIWFESDGGRLLQKEDREFLLRLAKLALEQAVDQGESAAPPATGIQPPARTTKPMGGFVTLKSNGSLRGCIGEIFPTRPLWRVVLEQTVNAALHDPRFPPVSRNELGLK